MSKHYDCNSSLNEKILSGVAKLADNVAATYGPRGRNVLLQSAGRPPVITKDGVTVAKFIELEDPFENAGAQVIKQSAIQTNSDAGDGTTTATILSRAILDQSQKYLSAGASPVELKRGMDKALDAVVENLKQEATPISSQEDIAHIATISANGDNTIGSLIAMAVDQVGKNGAITVEEARSLKTTLDVSEGFQINSGYISPAFVTDERRGAARHTDAFVLVTDKKIETVDAMLPVLELVSRSSRPLIIVAEEVEGQALAALIMNTMRGTLKVAAVKAPRYGEERRQILRDLATVVGATFVSVETGKQLNELKLTDLGTASTVEITKHATTFVDGGGDTENVEKRVDELKADFEAIDETDLHACERLQERITRLASGVAIIRVGAATEIEMIEKKHRIEDALEAVRSAQQEGIVPGGGVALIRAVQTLEVDTTTEDQDLGVKIIRDAAYAPLRQMATNAGESADLIIDKVCGEVGNNGYDFSSKKITNLVASGVIDPVKVTRCALQNAVSVASTLITTNHAVIEV